MPPFSPGGSRTPAQAAAAAASLQARQQQRHALTPTPLRPNARDAATLDPAGRPGGDDDADADADAAAEEAAQAPQPSLAQTLANARAMLAGLNMSPPSTPAPARPSSTATAALTPTSAAMDKHEDQAMTLDPAEEEEEEDEGDGGEDNEDEDRDEEEDEEEAEDDDLQPSASEFGMRESDEGLRDAGDDVRQLDAQMLDFPDFFPAAAQQRAPPIPPPPIPSAFLLASAAAAQSQPGTPDGSPRPFGVRAWADGNLPSDLQHVHPDSPSATSQQESDPLKQQAASLQLHQPVDAAEQQALTLRLQQAGSQPPVPDRAPPPQPSIMQLQNYSAPKPTRRTVPNAYADLAGQPSMDPDAYNSGPDQDGTSDAAEEDPDLEHEEAEADLAKSTPQESPQGPPLLDNLAASGVVDENGWDDGQAGRDSLEIYEDELLQDPISDAVPLFSEGLLPRPATSPGNLTSRRKVSFLDASG